MEMELTMPLPCRQRRPASITSHLELSTITGTLAMSGSEAIRFRKRTMAALLSSMASSMFTSMTWAPFSTCWRATASFFVLLVQDQARKGLGAGDVGALAHVDEQRVLADEHGLQARQAHGRNRDGDSSRHRTHLCENNWGYKTGERRCMRQGRSLPGPQA
jgi:hypothetical protein